MKFKVREGFVVHHSKVIEIDLGGGETKKEIQTNTYYQGQNVDFTADEAEDHLHKLEPFDKEAQKYLEGRAAPVTELPVPGAVDAQAIAAAVAAALQALGITGAAPTAPPAA